MKSVGLALTFCFFINSPFAQTIKVPDFADPKVKAFYQSHADHLLKCVAAIPPKRSYKGEGFI